MCQLQYDDWPQYDSAQPCVMGVVPNSAWQSRKRWLHSCSGRKQQTQRTHKQQFLLYSRGQLQQREISYQVVQTSKYDNVTSPKRELLVDCAHQSFDEASTQQQRLHDSSSASYSRTAGHQ
jgi:hypothetical protein